MTERGTRGLAWAWAAVVVATVLQQVSFWRSPNIETDVLALLPRETGPSHASEATKALADAGARRVVIAIGAANEDDARRAAVAWRDALPRTLGWQATPVGDVQIDALLDFHRPWRQGLLSHEQRQALRAADDESLSRQALERLYRPGGNAGLSSWAADPLDLTTGWWASHSGETLARPRGGELMIDGDDRSWVVLLFDTGRAAFALDGTARIAPALQAAREAARHAAPDVDVLAAGIPLHAESAAVNAAREVNVIGWGSLLAVLALVWLAFRRVQSLLLVGLTLVIGVGVATAVTTSLFGGVHLITLVFGATLVGVAEDYGIHYFASRQADPATPPARLIERLSPGLLLALTTSVLGYLVLAVAPFPGLRQIAVFSATGLTAAFVSAFTLFPVLDRRAPPRTRAADWLSDTLARIPRLTAQRSSLLAIAVLIAAGGWSLSQLQIDDSLRQLQSSPPHLIEEQSKLGSLLGLPSPSQFFIVTADSPQALLEREESLTAELHALVARGRIGGYRALSDWLPSAKRQSEDARLVGELERKVIDNVNARLGESLPAPAAAPAPMTTDDWLANPAASASARDLWLGELAPHEGRAPLYGSIVMLRGLTNNGATAELAALASRHPGVEWADRAAEVGGLLMQYRRAMSWLLVVGHGLVLALLLLRYRKNAWRAWLPTALGSVLAVGVLGATGTPLQLFNVLALLLLLGVGIDYGIFLQEHGGDGSAWLAVIIGAASTLLSFGLLGLSTTPALRSFGVTLAAGLLFVLLLSPLLRVEDP